MVDYAAGLWDLGRAATGARHLDYTPTSTLISLRLKTSSTSSSSSPQNLGARSKSRGCFIPRVGKENKRGLERETNASAAKQKMLDPCKRPTGRATKKKKKYFVPCTRCFAVLRYSSVREQSYATIAVTVVASKASCCCCCCCCLHIKSRSGLYSVLSNIRTGPTDANAFRLTTQKGYTYQK